MEEDPVNRSATLDAPLALADAAEAWEGTVDRERALDRFLAGVERRALAIARMALRDPAEAEDAVQDAMMRLVRHYGRRPEEEWRPLFYRILGNRITDFQRRHRVRRAVIAIWSGAGD
jgi:RNA polymerase sigma-70 factor (ECF subfamily)